MNTRETVLKNGDVLEFDGTIVSKLTINDLHVFLVKGEEGGNKNAAIVCTNEGGEILWTKDVHVSSQISPTKDFGQEGVMVFNPQEAILLNLYTGEREPFLL